MLSHDSDSPISPDDHAGYVSVISGAFEVYLDRERIRHALWKKYGAIDQIRQVKIKAERVMNTCGQTLTPEMVQEALSELNDIINYSVFTARILRGEVDQHGN